jgi:fatty-acid desaturase
MAYNDRGAYCRADWAKFLHEIPGMTIATENKLRVSWYFGTVIALLHVGALLALLPQFFSWQGVVLALVLHWITGGLGITLGWHRLVAHRSFQVPKWLEYFFVFCGTMAMQGGPIWWIGLHRHHHRFSDQPNDHHDSTKGFWWSHIGWMLYEVPALTEVPKFTKDLVNDPVYRFFDKFFFPMQVALGVLLYAIGTRFSVGDAGGNLGWSFVFWGIFARLVIVYHCTWLVNSATHKFGYRSHESGDNSTNCWWAALLTYGEGWHNNHHAYQYSARHGLEWWEFDMTWMVIKFLKAVGLATKVQVPNIKNLDA